MKIGIAGFFETSRNYRRALAFSHARLPFSTTDPLLTEVSLNPADAQRWDGLILPGGGDIDPALLPGQNRYAPPRIRAASGCCRTLPYAGGSIDPDLDRKQLAILEQFAALRRPVLGICKGMQLINVFFGGGLYAHLPQAKAHRYKECDQFHPSHAERGSFLACLYGESFPVNSAHHQGVSFPGKNIRIIQRAPDGVIEAIEHTFLPITGLQWHPERLLPPLSDVLPPDGSFPEGNGIPDAARDFIPPQRGCPAQRPPSAADGSLVFARFLTDVRTDMRRRLKGCRDVSLR